MPELTASSRKAKKVESQGQAHSRTVLKTLFTFRSITFANAESGCVSNRSPHVAPAFANRISIWSVVFSTSFTSLSISSILALSAGIEIACAPGLLLGRALRVSTAEAQAEALREVM